MSDGLKTMLENFTQFDHENKETIFRIVLEHFYEGLKGFNNVLLNS